MIVSRRKKKNPVNDYILWEGTSDIRRRLKSQTLLSLSPFLLQQSPLPEFHALALVGCAPGSLFTRLIFLSPHPIRLLHNSLRSRTSTAHTHLFSWPNWAVATTVLLPSLLSVLSTVPFSRVGGFGIRGSPHPSLNTDTDVGEVVCGRDGGSPLVVVVIGGGEERRRCSAGASAQISWQRANFRERQTVDAPARRRRSGWTPSSLDGAQRRRTGGHVDSPRIVRRASEAPLSFPCWSLAKDRRPRPQ
jgi:hypothetical protein